MQINPGNFDKKIEFLRYEVSKDFDGFEVKTENIVIKTWAQVTNISGTEILKNNSDFEVVKTRFLMRAPKVDINKDMVIKFNDNIYNIIYINDYSYDKKYTEIMTELVIK